MKQLGLVASAVATLLMLSACQDLSSIPSSVDPDNPQTNIQPVYADPAMYLSKAEILESYSGVSCESLRHLIDYLDDIGSTDYFRGLSGSIKYQPRSCRQHEGAWNHLDDFLNPEAVEIESKLYLSKLDVPTRAFDRGFPRLDGSMIQTEEGDDLHEYFSIEFRTELNLGEADESGWYEFAILSDDGVRMNFDNSEEDYIDHGNKTPTKMHCASHSVYLEQGESLPATVDYFQGPRRHIALMLMWRKAESEDDAGHDELCGKADNNMYFTNHDAVPEPTQKFEGLVERGWSVVPAHIFRIPRDEYMNPCQSDHIMDVINESLTDNGDSTPDDLGV